jgi:hypothetical protein
MTWNEISESSGPAGLPADLRFISRTSARQLASQATQAAAVFGWQKPSALLRVGTKTWRRQGEIRVQSRDFSLLFMFFHLFSSLFTHLTLLKSGTSTKMRGKTFLGIFFPRSFHNRPNSFSPLLHRPCS